MKKMCFVAGLTCITCVMFFASFSANAQDFEGTVAECVKNDSPTGYQKFGMDGMKGEVTWVIKPGCFVRGPIYDSEGNVIKKGKLLAKTNDSFYKYDVLAAEGTLLGAKGTLKDAELEYARAERLAAKNAIPKKDKEKAEADLYKAQGSFKEAKANLEFAKFVVSLCTLRAPFDGYVQEVFTRRGGWSNIDYPALKLVRLSPLFVDVKMDRKLGREIESGEKTVSIVSDTTGEVVGAFSPFIVFTDDGVRIPISNKILLPKRSDVPIVYELTCVSNFDFAHPESKQLGVPLEAIFKDKDGSFVWQAVGQKFMQPNKAVAREFKVKKVYVTLTGKYREGISEKVELLKDYGALEEFDVLLGESPEGLKDGSEVGFTRIQTQFWPGDKVKVTVQ